MKTVFFALIAVLLAVILWAVAVGLAYGEWGVLIVLVLAVELTNTALHWETYRMLKTIFNGEGKIYPEAEGTVARLRQWIKEIRQ